MIKRIAVACLALFFLSIPASAFLLQELPPLGYKPPDTVETKSSFKEMNDILGAEHLYNRLPEEYTSSLKIHYDNVFLNGNSQLNWSGNFAANGLTDQSSIPQVPISAEISQHYPNGDRLYLQLRLNVDDRFFYTGDAYTEIGGITVYLDFEENEQLARFFYQENTYILSLCSENTDIMYYLTILLDAENPAITYFQKEP